MKPNALFLGIIVFLVCIQTAAHSYLRKLTLSDLAQKSEAVLVAAIGDTRKSGVDEPYQLFTTELRIQKIYSGKLDPKQPVQLTTVLLLPGIAREDPPIPLPEKGSVCLFFLSKDDVGRWRLVNSRQGCWLMKDGEIAVPLRPTIAEVEKALPGLLGSKTGNN